MLLVLVLSFILSSLLSLFFLDDFDSAWTSGSAHQHSLHIAHSTLPITPPHTHPHTPTPHKPHAPHSPTHHAHSSSLPSHTAGHSHSTSSPSSSSPLFHERGDNDTDGATDAALGVSLSRLLFSALEDDERVIDAMEQRVREAKAAQQRTKPAPTSPYATQPLLLANLTQQQTTHLALLQRTNAEPPAGEGADDAAATFSLLVVEGVEGAEGSGGERSRVDWYRRPAASFFLPAPPSLRLIVTDDWQVSGSSTFPGRVGFTAVTMDHSWLALAVTRMQPPFDYTLALRIFHNHQQHIDVELPGHQPITALTFLSHNATSATLLVARHLDTRRFRAFHLVQEKEEEEDGLRVEQGEDGPAVAAGVGGSSGGDVVRLLHYREGEEGEECVVLIEYDERLSRQSPFAAALYSLTRPTDGSRVNDSQLTAASAPARAELVAVSDAVTHEPLTPAQRPAPSTDVEAQPSSVEEQPSRAAAVASASSSLSFPPSSSSSSWQLTSTLPRYRSGGSVHPIPPSALVSSSSPSHAYVVYASTPFLTTVERSHAFAPIEIIHLHPSTSFTHIAVSEVGSLIALIDQQRDIILLQRAQSAAAAYTSSPPAAAEAKSQWEVALELILPSLLKRLPVLSASILTARQHAAPHTTTAVAAAASQQARADDGDSGGPYSSSSTPPQSERMSAPYLCLLLEGGVLATFALDASAGLDAAAVGSALDSSALEEAEVAVATGLGIDAVGELLWLNWEFLIGQTS